jgi:hypothetical protein
MTSIESIPQVWDDERDGQFFHLTAAVFPPSFCCGASVLLASYDTDDEPAVAAVATAESVPAPTASLETTPIGKGAAR